MKNKQKRNSTLEISPGQGVFYAQKKCPICKKLLVGRSEKSYGAANSDLGQKLKAHQEERKKDKQLNLLPAATPGEQSKTISRVTLRGERIDPPHD
ncbi:hypothetical protein ES702_07223 [subsurface metagenome]